MVVTIVMMPIIIPVVMAIPVVVAAVFAADVMTVDPVVAVIGPMARDPNHLPIARPVAGAMAVIGPVAYFDAEALCRNGSRENDAGDRERGEQ